MKEFYSLILFFALGVFTCNAQTTLPCNVNLTATTLGNGGCILDSITYTNPNLALNNTFTFPGVQPNVLSGSITITAMGDIDLTSEYWTLLSEAGATLTQAGGSGGQCATVYVVTVPLTAADLLAWSANGTIDFQVNGTTAVNTSLCGGDYVQLTLETCYPVATCTGTDVNLVASGAGIQILAMSNDFDNGLGVGWVAGGGSAVGSPCGPGPNGTSYYWASTAGSGTPQLATIPYDVTCGGTISFDMVYSIQGGSIPCEGPDEADEGVELQYSTDGGVTWIPIIYYSPGGFTLPSNPGNGGSVTTGPTAYTNWSTFTVPIPPGALGPNTQFQWIQAFSSGSNYDNWGLDNVQISLNANCNNYWYDFDHIPGSPDPNTDTLNVTNTTTFGVWYTDGVDSCYATTTVVVPPAAAADAGPDITICGGGNALIGADPITLDEGSVYTWSTGATGTIDLTAPGTDNGQITVNPIATTEYYLEVDFNNCTAYDTVTVFMDNAPTASNPLPINVECIGDVPAPDPLVVTDEMDDLTPMPIVTHEGDVSDGQSCPETITRTFRITDDCGNFILVDQIITVNDVTPPTASNIPGVFVPGGSPLPPVDITLVDDEADNCTANPVVAWVSDVSDNGVCPEIITRTYSVTDDCGNQILVTQEISIGDPIQPTASNPLPIQVECIGDVPAPDPLVVTDEADNGAAIPVVTFESDVSDGLTCPETITRTYRVTDDCSNFIFVTQTITVLDTQAPTAGIPATINVECIGDVPQSDITVVPGVTDNCSANPAVAFVGDVSDGLSCPETITRTYSITDECGNTSTVDQTIIVNDVTPPTANNPSPVAVPGANDVPAPNPMDVTGVADNCSANPIVTWVSDVSDGNVCNGEIITRTYSVTDDCGNQITVTQEITILAEPAPIDAGPNQTICEGDLVTITPTNPWNAALSWNPVPGPGPFSPAQTTTYYVTADNLGCISEDSVTITVEEAPMVSFVGDVLAGCAPHTVTFTNTSSSATGLVDCEWTINGQSISGCGTGTYTFENSGTYDVTLTATSNTGCTSTATYADYIYVEAVPVAAFSTSGNTLESFDTQVQFTNNTTGASSYSWDFGDDSPLSTDVNPVHSYPEAQSGNYTVTLIATSPLGCVDVTSTSITVNEQLIYYIPNTFTPDNDDFNDTFRAVFTEGYDPFDFQMVLFNRWGEVIWESYDASVGWDGTYGINGRPAQDGTYIWKIEFKTTQTDERVMITGHVNLIR